MVYAIRMSSYPRGLTSVAGNFFVNDFICVLPAMAKIA